MHDISGSIRFFRFQIPVELTHLHPLAPPALRLVIRQRAQRSVGDTLTYP